MNNTIITDTISLKKEFIMTEQDIMFLHSLPSNLPETKLKRSEIDKIHTLYHRYISKNQVYKGWGIELYTIEQREKWPSGHRVKTHEAQRMILGWLANYNQSYNNICCQKLLDLFHSALTNRESNQILLSKIYNIK